MIDEVLTPDSSRFWKKDDYSEGNSPNPYDKQFLRDWLNQQDWNKTPPPPSIPNEVINNTLGRYLEIYELLTNDKLNIVTFKDKEIVNIRPDHRKGMSKTQISNEKR